MEEYRWIFLRHLILLNINFWSQNYMPIDLVKNTFILSFLSTYWQWTKVKTHHLVLGKIYFRVCHTDQFLVHYYSTYLNDIFLFLNYNFCNFKDDTKSFTGNKSLEFVLNELECNFNIAIDCFQNNYMNMNFDNCLLLVAVLYNCPLLVLYLSQISANLGQNRLWTHLTQSGLSPIDQKL